MGEPHVLGALHDKRSELAGMVISLERQLVQHRASLTHLDATMRLFDPEFLPEEILHGSGGPATPGFVLVNAFA